MVDYYELDFLVVEIGKSGDVIIFCYLIDGVVGIYVVDGGYFEIGDKVVEYIRMYYGVMYIDYVVLMYFD